MNAINYLIQQHDKFRKLLARLTSSSGREDTKRKLFEKISTDLAHHEKMEQKVWYPFLKKNTNLAKTIALLISEEKMAAKQITKIKKIRDREEFEDKLIELSNDVLKHANDEETKLFPKVIKVIDETELNTIGKKMKAMKKELAAKLTMP